MHFLPLSSRKRATRNTDYVEQHSLVAFLGDPSKLLCGAADDDEGDTGAQSNVTAIERGTD